MTVHNFSAKLLEPSDALLHAENCGRMCWQSDPKEGDTTRKFLGRIIKRGHTSVLEHVGLMIPHNAVDGSVWKHAYPTDGGVLVNARTLLAMCERNEGHAIMEDSDIEKFLDIVENSTFVPEYRPTFDVVCDRAVSHEYVRHRVAVFSQESQRYVRYDDSTDIVINPALPEDVRLAIEVAAAGSFAVYTVLRNKGVPPQIARTVLPNCCRTRMSVSMWAWEWEWFLQLRDDGAAHPDMRLVAGMVRDELAGSRDLAWWEANADKFGVLRQLVPTNIPLPE